MSLDLPFMRNIRLSTLLLALLACFTGGCEQKHTHKHQTDHTSKLSTGTPSPAKKAKRPAPEPAYYQSEVEEGIGAAIAILVDSSGSMGRPAPGEDRPKYLVAREAVSKMLEATDAFVVKRPDFRIKVALLHFSSGPWLDLPIQSYDRATLIRALHKLPVPKGGTAIGRAMMAARRQLYRSGVFRKYIVVVTDGENTSGRDPRHAAEELHRMSEEELEHYFGTIGE